MVLKREDLWIKMQFINTFIFHFSWLFYLLYHEIFFSFLFPLTRQVEAIVPAATVYSLVS